MRKRKEKKNKQITEKLRRKQEKMAGKTLQLQGQSSPVFVSNVLRTQV